MNRKIFADTSMTVFQKPEDEAFLRHRKFLEEGIDPDFGLLDKLLETGTLSWREMADIKAKDTFYKRNSELLDLISSKRKYDRFVDALTDVNQSHVVNYLIGDGEYRTEFDGCWPLAESELSILQVNHGSLVEILDPCDLVVRLFSAEVITFRQKEFISSRRSRSDQNEALLEMIRKRTRNDYRKTIDCLRASNQDHVAEVLDQGGVVLRIHANLDAESVLNVSDVEDEISSAMASMVGGVRSMDELNRIQQLTRLKWMAAKRGESVVVFVYCETDEEMHQLHVMLTTGRLRDCVELLFNQLLMMKTRIRRLERIAVTSVKVNAEEFQRAEKYFRDSIGRCRLAKDGTEETSTSFISSVTALPLELLDIVLEKSYLHFVFSDSDGLRDDCVVRRLSSVDFCWFQRLRRRRFKRNIWNQLSVFHRRVDVLLAIMRCNRSYLVEYIETKKELVGRLRSTDCLTDLELRLMARKRLRSDDYKTKSLQKRNNNSDILHLMRSKDDRRRSSFVRSLNAISRCRFIADVLENGGVVVRATILTEESVSSRRSLEQELVKRLDDVREAAKRRRPMSEATERLLSQWKDEDVEMLNCHLDGHRRAVVWIWCRSQRGLEKLRAMDEDRRSLMESLRVLSNSPSSTPQTIQPRTINIDKVQFRKRVVERPIVVKFTARLSVGKSEEVKGVTKLRSEIYALCRSISPSSPNVIRVFEDCIPFRLQKEVDIKDITDPEDIGSSDRENLLYVTDLGKKCVWKITREADDYPVVKKWSNSDLRWPYTLSVTSDGQLLMLSGGNPVSSLEIYGSDAELRRCIQLPREIQMPLHAVQTSTKTFIITHKRRERKESEGEREEERERGETWSVSEVTSDGQMVVRRFIPRNEKQQLNNPFYVSLNSEDRVFVADTVNDRVILFDADLRWNGILCPTKDEGKTIFRSWRLSFDNTKNQLIVGGLNRGVNIYTLSRR